MRRRNFLLGSLAAALPSSSFAQKSAVPVVGFFRSTTATGYESLVTALRAGLRTTGFIENENVRVEYRWAEGHRERIPAIVDELIALNAAVLVGNSAAAVEAKSIVKDRPLVFVAGDDPVNTGLVTNLHRPGGNITGVSFMDVVVAAKRLGLLLELLPPSATIAALVDSSFYSSKEELRSLQASMRAIQRPLVVLTAVNEAEISAAFDEMVRHKVAGVFVGAGPKFNVFRRMIISLAAQHAIPATYSLRENAMAGGLMSYSASQVDAYRRAGIYIGRILHGEKPGELPVELPTRYEFVLNMKTAKSLGLRVPNSLALLADEIIE
jgi:putative ABC transport system substrate-binding protein